MSETESLPVLDENKWTLVTEIYSIIYSLPPTPIGVLFKN